MLMHVIMSDLLWLQYSSSKHYLGRKSKKEVPHSPELLQKSELNSLVMISTPMEASFFADFVDIVWTILESILSKITSK